MVIFIKYNHFKGRKIMDVVTHGVQGGLLYAFPVKILFLILGVSCPWFIALLFIWGFIEGSFPDTYSWAVWKFSKVEMDRWKVWREYHYNYSTMIWRFFPAFLFHVKLVDPIFHKRPLNISEELWDANPDNIQGWWPRMSKLATVHWGLTLMFLYAFLAV
jgi:hypothetical protein